MSGLVKNDLVTGVIEGYTSEGLGVLRADGVPVFVPETARGDRCTVRIVKVLKNRAYGRLEQILKPSLHRTESKCPVFPRCGGPFSPRPIF